MIVLLTNELKQRLDRGEYSEKSCDNDNKDWVRVVVYLMK